MHDSGRVTNAAGRVSTEAISSRMNILSKARWVSVVMEETKTGPKRKKRMNSTGKKGTIYTLTPLGLRTLIRKETEG